MIKSGEIQINARKFGVRDQQIEKDYMLSWILQGMAQHERLSTYIREETNIPLAVIENNEHIDGGINFYISFVGPLGGSGSNKRVKVDISRSEQLQFEPVICEAILIYSDQQKHKLLCYPLEEVLVEKLRSVIQRMQARDFYDIWYLLEIHKMNVEFYMNEFIAKCESKGISQTDFQV